MVNTIKTFKYKSLTFKVVSNDGDLIVLSNNGTRLPIESCCESEKMKLKTISYLKSLPEQLTETQLRKKYESLRNN